MTKKDTHTQTDQKILTIPKNLHIIPKISFLPIPYLLLPKQVLHILLYLLLQILSLSTELRELTIQ